MNLAEICSRVRLCAAAVSLLLGRIGRWSGREIDASQGERLGRSCLSIVCSELSLARSAQAEHGNESCFLRRAAAARASGRGARPASARPEQIERPTGSNADLDPATDGATHAHYRTAALDSDSAPSIRFPFPLTAAIPVSWTKSRCVYELQRYMHIKFTRCLSYRGNYDDKSKEQIPDIEAYLVPLTELATRCAKKRHRTTSNECSMLQTNGSLTIVFRKLGLEEKVYDDDDDDDDQLTKKHHSFDLFNLFVKSYNIVIRPAAFDCASATPLALSVVGLTKLSPNNYIVELISNQPYKELHQTVLLVKANGQFAIEHKTTQFTNRTVRIVRYDKTPGVYAHTTKRLTDIDRGDRSNVGAVARPTRITGCGATRGNTNTRESNQYRADGRS
ncbi:hypothetical protein EVAR_77105_1 [Eumeta japonica]|uniref:Uncharacterized protein n=1 Tax=Eumeta variegata TaxID=151549 RepID=A0A4C1T4M0_EUMVA|nr:hypothetical protein EVAR_77105_1 [Eumeta japonica]